MASSSALFSSPSASSSSSAAAPAASAAAPASSTAAPSRPARPRQSALQVSPEALALLQNGRMWRGDALAPPPEDSIPSGFRKLDCELPGGGWPTHCLTELLSAEAGIGEIRLLAQALQTLTRTGRQVILLAPPCLPYPDGWARLGIDPDRLLVVRAERPVDRLWAIEQSLRSTAFGALLAWVPQAPPEALRRLQLAAANANGLCFLFRPPAAQYQPSPAPLRLLLEGIEGRTLAVRLLKRRGPVHGKTLHLALPELHALHSLRSLRATRDLARTVPADETPHATDARAASAAFAEATAPFIPAAGAADRFPVLADALDRLPLSQPAARSHPAPLA